MDIIFRSTLSLRGKGNSRSSGVVISLMLFPKYCFMFTVFGIFFFALVARISRYVSLASLIGMAMFFVEFLIWGILRLASIKWNRPC